MNTNIWRDFQTCIIVPLKKQNEGEFMPLKSVTIA